jgi:hypothetical protein
MAPVALADSRIDPGDFDEQLAKSERLRWIAKYVAEELLERGGQIAEREIGPLLREAVRDYRRSSYGLKPTERTNQCGI